MGKFSSPKIEFPAQPAPPPPASYASPQGVQRYDPASNTYTFEESPATRAAREAREAKRQEILDSLRTSDPARVAQLNELRDTFYNDLVTLTVAPIERQLLQRGQAGSYLGETSARLRAEAGKQALFAKESLQQADVQQKLQTLGALEAGQSAETAAELQRAALAQRGTLEQQALSEARYRTQFEGQLARSNLASQTRGQNLQLLGQGANAIGSIAFLKALGG